MRAALFLFATMLWSVATGTASDTAARQAKAQILLTEGGGYRLSA